MQETVLCLAVIVTLCSCGVIIPEERDEFVDGRLRIAYWEKWTGFEGQAIQDVVDRFNTIQDDMYVDLVTVSQIDRKALVAIAGGDPPDLMGIWSAVLVQFAEKRALMCLDPYMDEHGMRRDDFIDVLITLGTYSDKLYALPTTPATVALHWNKALFEEAGLDPESPPRTLDELDRMAEQLTKYDDDGNLTQIGFMPSEPTSLGTAWWPWMWVYWFGGSLWDDELGVTFDTPENMRAHKWVLSYAEKYGPDKLRKLESSFGNFSSQQNPFLSGKVAMMVQGVWMNSFIAKYAPEMRWGAAPFPSAVPKHEGVSMAETDSICIPVGARHPDEAFVFIKYVCSQEGQEMLNMGQRKFSSLKEVSPEFIADHPNPYISVFRDLAMDPAVFYAPQTSIWYEYLDEINPVFEMMKFAEGDPEILLPGVQQKMTRTWQRARKRIEARAEREVGS
jgi:multiple sugar transport system substrate-binding protein